MYLGIDIHKRYAQVAVLDENGEVEREVRVENANLDEIARQYAGSEAAIEATSNYYHIHILFQSIWMLLLPTQQS